MQDHTQDRISVFNRIYARCRRLVPDAVWRKLVDRTPSPETFPDILHDPVPGIELLGTLLGRYDGPETGPQAAAFHAAELAAVRAHYAERS